MFRYSYSVLPYYGEDLADSLARLARCGYDGVELPGEPAAYDPARVGALCAEHGLAVSSVCSLFVGPDRDLAAADPQQRARAVDYVKAVADFAAAVGAPVAIVAPSILAKLAPAAEPQREWGWAVEAIREAADHAAANGVRLCIEAWNRYETYFLNRIDQALQLMRAVGHPHVGVMADTFHMNIEDPSAEAAIRAAGADLLHVHFADSNRAAPGRGHLDFRPVLRALHEIGFSGHITFELLPASADPFAVMKRGGGREFFDDYTERAIRTIKALEREITP